MNRRPGQIRHLDETYGLTEDDFDTLLEIQEGACAICRLDEERIRDDGSTLQLSVDHIHDSADRGRVRLLLCCRCNLALGLFRDDPVILQQAVEYLKLFGHHKP